MKKYYIRYRGKNASKSPKVPDSAIPRIEETPPVLTVDQATEGDFRYFCAHPDEDQYIRQFVPGEFGPVELPPVPAGFRYATLVSVTMRVGGEPIGRFRELMAVCEDTNELGWNDATRNRQGSRIAPLAVHRDRTGHASSTVSKICCP